MRIAFLTPEYRTEEQSYDGGLANYLYAIARSLVDIGHEPHIFVPGSHRECFTDSGVTVHRVAHGAFSMRRIVDRVSSRKTPTAFYWLNLSNSLNEALRQVHRATPFSIAQYSSFGATGYYRVKSIPGVVRISSFEPLHRLARGPGESPTQDELRVEKLEFKSMLRADAVFGPGKHTADAVSRAIGRKVEIIESPFYPEESNCDESVYNETLKNKKYLLYFGTLWSLKGVDVIASILPELFERYDDVYFAFVGKDFGSLKTLLRSAQNFPNRMIYLGKQPHKTLYPIIRNSYAVVLPSLYDNFSNACLEAMGSGKIVVGTRQTSFEQLIEHRKSGLLVQPGDPFDLLAVIDRLLQLPEDERNRIARGALDRAHELRPARVVKQLVDFYNRVIEMKA